MIWLAIWAMAGLLAGICLVIFVPWTAATIAGDEYREMVSDWYVYLAQTAASKTAVVARPGTLDLVPKRYDAAFKGDRDSTQDDPQIHYNNFDVLSRIKNKPFGFALDSHAEYVSPLLAEVGDQLRDLKDMDEVGAKQVTVKTSDGKRKREQQMHDGIAIPSVSQLVDIEAARYLTSGDCAPEDPYKAKVKTNTSQEKFHEKVSFGTMMIVVIAGLATLMATWFITDSSSGADATGTTISLLALFGSTAKVNSRTLAAGAWVAMWLLVVPVLSFLLGGILVGAITTAVMFGTAISLVGGVILFGPSLPVSIGMIFCNIFWILAQITVGRGVLVRRATGEYEHRRLRDGDETTYKAVLSDGKELPIKGTNGDLTRFMWAPLGITEEKTADNMEKITEDLGNVATDGGEIRTKNQRLGYQPVLDVPTKGGWLVTGPQLVTWCRGTAESAPIEQARDDALTKQGGEQQVGPIVKMAGTLISMVIFGIMGWIIGGGMA